MWVFLPMVSLLIRAIVGTPDDALSNKIGLGNASENLPNDNHTGRPLIDAWRMSKGVPLKERNKREIDLNGTPTDEIKVKNLPNSDEIVPKRRGTMVPAYEGLWFLPTRKEGFEKVSQERTSPWHWWQNDKRTIDEPTLSCECKLREKYHHAFDGGGKRGALYTSNLDSKRTKTNDDDGSKRQELRKTMVWDKWGGKRAEISDRERVLLFLRNPDVRILNVIGDGLRKERAARIKDRILTMFGKRDSDNETSDDERINEIDDWSAMPVKKTGHGYYKKTKFNPWGGKRSAHSWDDYVECMIKTIKRDLNS